MADTPHTPGLASPFLSEEEAARRRQPARAVSTTSQRKPGHVETKDGFREIIEMIVFVVVLVLLLKSFVAEAFVIPTGSMATTLWGYQKVVTCPQCAYEFPVNCSDEYDKKAPHDDPDRFKTTGGTCPNCRYEIHFGRDNIQAVCRSGDRVLVAKCFYDTGLFKPKPFDVVVFKPPHEPQVNFEPRNYIKRLIGLPGQTIGIWYGDIYRLPAEKGVAYDDSHLSPDTVWQKSSTHTNQSVDLLTQRNTPFEILRKPPDEIIAMRRIVFDNDHQPQDRKAPEFARWAGDAAVWKSTADNGFASSSSPDASVAWLRYSNLLRGGTKPELITDFMGYNSKTTSEPFNQHDRTFAHSARNWVGDLMLEAEVSVDRPDGVLIMELSEGIDRFQARWTLNTGECKLIRQSAGQETEISSKSTAVSKPGRYKLAFANVDERLTVWVNGKLAFDNGVAYDTPAERGPDENDLQPASIGVQGASVTVNKLKLWRDTYYTVLVTSPSDLSVRLSEGPRRFQPAGNADADVNEVQKLLETNHGVHRALQRSQEMATVARASLHHDVRAARPLPVLGRQQPFQSGRPRFRPRTQSAASRSGPVGVLAV